MLEGKGEGGNLGNGEHGGNGRTGGNGGSGGNGGEEDEDLGGGCFGLRFAFRVQGLVSSV